MSAGNTEFNIPSPPSGEGMRDVFYLDSLGKGVSPFAPRV